MLKLLGKSLFVLCLFSSLSVNLFAQKSVTFSFFCDMTSEIKSGRFNPDTDTLSLRGFNNEMTGRHIMSASKTVLNQYTISLQRDCRLGDTISYKYAYVTGKGVNWESGEFRILLVTNDILAKGTAAETNYFNNIFVPGMLLKDTYVRFAVDMKNAVAGAGPNVGKAFEKIETVIVTGEVLPLRMPNNGWPDEDSIMVIRLNDEGNDGDLVAGDQIWTKELLLPKYTPASFQYKYGVNYGLPGNLGLNNNESIEGTYHRVFLPSDIYRPGVNDHFGTMGTSEVVETILIDRTELSGSQIPEKYVLEQNFPNPFNPSTVINFSLPQEGQVSLKVYNALGQEIAALVNGFRPAGNYQASFDATGMVSGIYFYTIQAGSFIQTKKMMVIK